MAVATEADVSDQTDSEIDDADVEIEHEDSQERITNPFDPEQIKIRTVNVVVEQLVSRIRHDEIDLAPDFQRLRGIWSDEQKSRLIESLLLRIPIPVFYVAADKSEIWSVVDGIQRMSAIHDYVIGTFPLNRLQYLTWLDGCEHDDLPRPMQRRISETQLVVNIIEPGTPAEVMFNVFLRINTGGLTLNGQEIRHAVHPGVARDYLKELAESNEFVKATDGSVNRKRMADRECVLRFLAFHIDPWENYNTNDLDGYLGNIMDKLNKTTSMDREDLSAAFTKAMVSAVEIFGRDAFRKPRGEDGRRRPVNRALFEAWSVRLARCSREQIDTLVGRREDIRHRFTSLVQEDRDFDRSISYSTGSPKRVWKRFETVSRLIEEFF